VVAVAVATVVAVVEVLLQIAVALVVAVVEVAS